LYISTQLIITPASFVNCHWTNRPSSYDFIHTNTLYAKGQRWRELFYDGSEHNLYL